MGGSGAGSRDGGPERRPACGRCNWAVGTRSALVGPDGIAWIVIEGGTLVKLDPATGKVIEYPPPAIGNGMREFNNDPQGRMWFASPGNNTVGYLSLAK